MVTKNLVVLAAVGLMQIKTVAMTYQTKTTKEVDFFETYHFSKSFT